MSRIFIPCFFIFVISSVPLWGENTVFHWRVQADYTLFITKGDSLQTQIQHSESLQNGFLFALGDHFYIDSMIGMYHVHNSALREGYRYRGSDNLIFRLTSGARLKLTDTSSTIHSLWLGIGAGPEAVIGHYLSTSIYFFYPAAYIEPFLDLRITPPSTRWHLRFSLTISTF